MKVCGWKLHVATALAVACLNYIFAIGTFGQLFACADMWGKCTPSSALSISNSVLSFPLSLTPVPGLALLFGIEIFFALNALVWGLAAFVLMRIVCRAVRT